MHTEPSLSGSIAHGAPLLAEPPDEPPRSARGLRAPTASLVAPLAVGLLTVLPTLRARFLYDDTTIIRDNAGLRGWRALLEAWHAPYWPAVGADAAGLYRPFHVSLLAAVWNLGQGSPLAFHLFALTLYAAVVALVWRVMREGVARTAALLAGLGWLATSALHVEVVASVSNSSDLLVAGFTLALALLLVRSPRGAPSRAADWVRALAASLLTLAAMTSKESGLLALPLAAVTAWGWRAPGTAPRTVTFIAANARVWLAGAATLVIVLLMRMAVLGAPFGRASMAAPGLESLGGLERAAAMVSLWPRIASMLVWPSGLAPYYGPSILADRRAALGVLAALVSLAIVALAIAFARRGDRRPLVAIAWIALTYLPAANLLVATGVILADRVLFGATVGVALGMTWAVERAPASGRAALLVVLAVVGLRGAAQRLEYALDWTTHRRLWSRLVREQPAEYRGYQLLGIDARERGDTGRALPLLARAFAMEPRDRRVRFEYGQALYVTGRHAQAAATLAPLLANDDVRREGGFVSMYLDAVARSAGPAGVVEAGMPLLRTEAAGVAGVYVGGALERLGRAAAADSVYAAALRMVPGDSALAARRSALRRPPARR